MKIGVDAGCLGIQDKRLKVGVYTVVKNLLIELGKSDKKNTYLLYSFYPIEKNLMKQFGSHMQNIITPSIGWINITLPMRLFIDRPDVFLAANQAMPLVLPFSHYKTIGLFYDIAFEKYPDLYSYAASVNKHKNNSKTLAEKSDTIIAISQSTKNDIEKYYHINSEKINVAYPGIENKIASLHAPRNDVFENPYFLFVGAFKKSKNIPFLLQAFDRFCKNAKKAYDLRLVGGDKWLDPDIEKTFARLDTKTKKHIIQMGFVDEQKLRELYKHAFAFVSPSLYEGFGLPFLEAQSMGIPIIGSNSGSLPEVIGESGLLVDPKNVTSFTNALIQLSLNKALHKKLSKLGLENVRKYSWKSFAKQIQSALESFS